MRKKSAKMSPRKGKPVHFKIKAKPGSKVSVAGTFNNWDPEAHPLQHLEENGLFAATIELAAGQYEYKFVIDGEWVEDPDCASSVPNQYGSKNSLIKI